MDEPSDRSFADHKSEAPFAMDGVAYVSWNFRLPVFDIVRAEIGAFILSAARFFARNR